MKVEDITLEELRIKGIEILEKNLGTIGMIRFLQYYDKGHGNYSKERHSWLGNPDIEDVVKDIKTGQNQ